MKTLFLLTLFVALLAPATCAQDAMRAPACTASQLSLAFDTEGGNFDGMSHSGALLVVRNISQAACTVLPKPALTFTGPDHKALPLTFAVPRFMHPGPVQIPVIIPAGAEVTGNMRWVSGEVYDKTTCVTPAYAALTTPRGQVQVAFGFRLCGPAGAPLTYEQEPVHRDPPLAPAHK